MSPEPQHLLTILLLLPMLAALAIACSPDNLARKLAISFGAGMFGLSAFILSQFDISRAAEFQLKEQMLPNGLFQL